uniref:Uncharacterized protein n=1 Tax=Arundo donax TaxID=35708 RepID=A0A0A9A6S9_ARUDO
MANGHDNLVSEMLRTELGIGFTNINNSLAAMNTTLANIQSLLTDVNHVVTSVMNWLSTLETAKDVTGVLIAGDSDSSAADVTTAGADAKAAMAASSAAKGAPEQLAYLLGVGIRQHDGNLLHSQELLPKKLVLDMPPLIGSDDLHVSGNNGAVGVLRYVKLNFPRYATTLLEFPWVPGGRMETTCMHAVVPKESFRFSQEIKETESCMLLLDAISFPFGSNIKSCVFSGDYSRGADRVDQGTRRLALACRICTWEKSEGASTWCQNLSLQYLGWGPRQYKDGSMAQQIKMVLNLVLVVVRIRTYAEM